MKLFAPLFLITLPLAASALARQTPPLKVRMSESYRKETLTTHSFAGASSVTEEHSAFKGKLNLTAEFPFSISEAAALGQDTTLEIHAGGFDRKVRLGDDPGFPTHPKALKLSLKERFETTSRRIVGTVTVRWEAAKCVVKLDAQVPDAGASAGAEAALAGGAGETQIETPVTLNLGGKTYTAKTILRGKVKEQHSQNGSAAYYEVLSVTLKG